MADNDILRPQHDIETHTSNDQMSTPIDSEYGDRVHIDNVSGSLYTPSTIHGEAPVTRTCVG